jgi:hypothetical protein
MKEKICEICRKDKAIVKVNLDGILYHNEVKYVCGQCRDNCDDEITCEMYENEEYMLKKYGLLKNDM